MFTISYTCWFLRSKLFFFMHLSVLLLLWYHDFPKGDSEHAVAGVRTYGLKKSLCKNLVQGYLALFTMPWLLYKYIKKCVHRDKLELPNSSGQGTRQAGSPSKQAPISRLAGSRLSASRRCQNCEAGAVPRRRGRSPRRASTKSSCCRRAGFPRGGREESRGTLTRSCPLQTQRERTTGWTWNPVMTQDNIFPSVSSVRGSVAVSKVSQGK